MRIRPALLLLPIVLIGFGYTIVTAQNADDDFGRLLAEGKENLIRAVKNNRDPTADTAAVREGYRRAMVALERAVALGDTSQEAHYFLGYAYDRYFSSLSPGEHLPETQLAAVEKVSHEMERVIAISPRYDGASIALDPYSKIGSEWGSLAMAMIAAGKSDSARWALEQGRRRGGFLDITLELAHNLLASCDSNAILFVNGDNDTFPLWYLQGVAGYRRDITVVNMPLANAAWYVGRMRAGYPFGTNALPLTLGEEQVDELEPRLISERTTATLAVPKEAMKAFGAAPRDGTIDLKITGHRYSDDERVILPQDDIILDVLRANGWRRPVNFSLNISIHDAAGLDLSDYLRMDGIAYRLTPRKLGGSRHVSIPFNNVLLFDSSRFQWRVLQGGGEIYSADAYGWIQNYLWAFLSTAEEYRNTTRRPDMVARTLARMEDLLPFGRFSGLYEELLPSFRPLYTYAGRMKQYRVLEESFR